MTAADAEALLQAIWSCQTQRRGLAGMVLHLAAEDGGEEAHELAIRILRTAAGGERALDWDSLEALDGARDLFIRLYRHLHEWEDRDDAVAFLRYALRELRRELPDVEA